jgi:hypothetical protein
MGTVEPLRYPFRGAQISAALSEQFELYIKGARHAAAADRVPPAGAGAFMLGCIRQQPRMSFQPGFLST